MLALFKDDLLTVLIILFELLLEVVQLDAYVVDRFLNLTCGGLDISLNTSTRCVMYKLLHRDS